MKVFTFWHGPALGPIELLSLKSHVKHGHSVDIYCYESVECDIPNVNIKDATEVVPLAGIFYTHHFKLNNITAFSDYFRHKKLFRDGGLWIDLDVVCLKNYDSIKAQSFIPHEGEHYLGTAILKLTKGNTLSKKVIDSFEMPFFPILRFVLKTGKNTQSLRRKAFIGLFYSLISRKKAYAYLPWGFFGGPVMISQFIKELKDVKLLSTAYFFPFGHNDAQIVFDPQFDYMTLINNPKAHGIHLYGNILREKLSEGMDNRECLWSHLIEISK